MILGVVLTLGARAPLLGFGSSCKSAAASVRAVLVCRGRPLGLAPEGHTTPGPLLSDRRYELGRWAHALPSAGRTTARRHGSRFAASSAAEKAVRGLADAV